MAEGDDEYLDGEEDISGLEDTEDESLAWPNGHDEEDGSGDTAADEDLPPLPVDVPVYRLRLPYSNETFLAAWPGDTLFCKTWVLAGTRHGKDLAQVIGTIQRRGAAADVARIRRVALPEDLEKAARNKDLEAEAFAVCREKI
jgi:hypothetical protein